jgi:hypothetical protein
MEQKSTTAARCQRQYYRRETATKSFRRRYSVKRMTVEPKIEAGTKMVILYPFIENASMNNKPR